MPAPSNGGGGPLGESFRSAGLAATSGSGGGLASSFDGSPRSVRSGAPREAPGDHATWKAQASSSLSAARALRQQAQLAVAGGSSSARTPRPQSQPVGSVATIAAAVAAAQAQDRWKKKVAASSSIATVVQDRLQTMHASIRRVSQGISSIQRIKGIMYAQQSVAEKRLEMREKRPTCELVKDSFEQALVQEKEALVRIREKMEDQIEVGKEALENLLCLHTELNRNRHTLHQDRSEKPKELLAEVGRAEETGASFCAQVGGLQDASQREADKLAGATAAAMKRRIGEYVELRRELEGEIHHTRCAIVDTEQHLEKIKTKLRRMKDQPELDLLDEGGDEHAPAAEDSAKLMARTARFADLRQRIKAAAYTGHAGRQLDVLFGRFDKNGSGQLDEDELRRALRRTLRIPPSAVSDAEIAHLCSVLDTDQSGQVSIAEIVAFLGAEHDVGQLQEQQRAAEALLEQLHDARLELIEDLRNKTVAWRIDESCVKVNASKALELDAFPIAGRPRQGPTVARRRKGGNLSNEAMEKIRAKLKSAAYTGHAGRQLEVLFARFDKDGSGCLDDSEVLKAMRRTLRIPESVISDSEIAALCAHLDSDDTGSVSIGELIGFVGPEPEVSQRSGKSMTGVTLAPINKSDAKGTSSSGGGLSSTAGSNALSTTQGSSSSEWPPITEGSRPGTSPGNNKTQAQRGGGFEPPKTARAA